MQRCVRQPAFFFYLCNSDAIRIKGMKNVIGKHQVNQRVFIHLKAEVFAVVPREAGACERPHSQQSSCFHLNFKTFIPQTLTDTTALLHPSILPHPFQGCGGAGRCTPQQVATCRRANTQRHPLMLTSTPKISQYCEMNVI